MVVGFNHNFRYRGELFHVQTEDSGLKSPHIITLLYRGGTILASKKTSYADITKVDRLEQVVEELMKEQHREMLRRLKSGEFDEIIVGQRSADAPAAAPSTVAPLPPPPATPAPKSEDRSEPTTVAGREQRPTVHEGNLDEIILSYLLGDEDEKKKA
jgi:hypothetical protein